MRLYYYAGASTALAAGVVISAFHQRANFYSACVYLSQSNLCLMILVNLILLIYGSFMYGLQRLCFGPLRPIEIEQLYEKAWFAITETCLAMTIFREEVGAWFLVMFVALLTGKVWGWIGDGRVEVLEQQPPANPRLFHIRLSISLGMSVLYDIWLMSYTIRTVIQQARPNMMVMFLFEFAVLATSSISTMFRYWISLIEASVVKKQTQERLAERRREVREERAQMIRDRAVAAEGTSESPSTDGLPNEEDVDEMDIEVPGWEAKGQWVLSLDLATDFVKLGIYSTFFFILLTFYGLPIHIMRDLFITARSFIRRLTAYLRYRRATQHMNQRYEDATVEDIAREDTCIICREEMRPWSVTNPPVAPGAEAPTRSGTVNERSRPKKLPCGHILHLGCLKSWLERQQVCPTCRRSVVESPHQAARTAAGNPIPAAADGQAHPPGPPGQPGEPGLPGQPGNAPAQGRGNRGMRMLNLGPLRLGFGQANLQDIAQGFREGQQGAGGGVGGPRVYGLELGFPRRQQQQPATIVNTGTIHEQIQALEQQLMQGVRSLQVAQQELQVIHMLQAELARLRMVHNADEPMGGATQIPDPLPQFPLTRQAAPFLQVPHMQRHTTRPNTSAIPAGSAELPPGVTIPEGWSLLPLQRLPGDGPVPSTRSASAPGTINPVSVSNPTVAEPLVSSNIPTFSQANITSFPPGEGPSNAADPASIQPPSSSESITAAPSLPSMDANPLPALNNNPYTSPIPQPASNWNFGSATPTAAPIPSHLFSSQDTPSSPRSPSPVLGQNILSTDEGSGSSTAVQIQGLNGDEAESEQRRREKGKAKAATVEDTVDEEAET
ncbi:hypothetical protein BP6252_07857 [Coleophoma cylindrospora]|uniref:RING-type E3 ubiquitin transferase n=1 Tax=Coleophoma cylindrospora TaxID=1849047 RepID=A0A3D8RBQ5_9HELO|nr:hypothetical protein BP6252_07857 [Coleophoma cylindrospora]